MVLTIRIWSYRTRMVYKIVPYAYGTYAYGMYIPYAYGIKYAYGTEHVHVLKCKELETRIYGSVHATISGRFIPTIKLVLAVRSVYSGPRGWIHCMRV